MKIIDGLNKESTISVEGTVRERSSKNQSCHRRYRGSAEKITVLGRCRHNSLPFEINHSREADETARLKYRYLDLRNPAVRDNIVLRCNVVSALRSAMTERGFLEITTPILTASSPEGARDYLVPSRKHPGKFYALPQAPQQFKQLLMTAGFDRYFQIAPCFRDEDARGDRFARRVLPARYGDGVCHKGRRLRCFGGRASRRYSLNSANTAPRRKRPLDAYRITTRWKFTAPTSLICASTSRCRI